MPRGLWAVLLDGLGGPASAVEHTVSRHIRLLTVDVLAQAVVSVVLALVPLVSGQAVGQVAVFLARGVDGLRGHVPFSRLVLGLGRVPGEVWQRGLVQVIQAYSSVLGDAQAGDLALLWALRRGKQVRTVHVLLHCGLNARLLSSDVISQGQTLLDQLSAPVSELFVLRLQRLTHLKQV